jgi:actin-related protein
MATEDEWARVALDCGAWRCRFGWAGDETCKDFWSGGLVPDTLRALCSLECVANTTEGVGSPRWHGSRRFLLADNTLKQHHQHHHQHSDFLARPALDPSGAITNWDIAEALWAHGFSQLSVDPAGREVLLTDRAHKLGCRTERPKTAEVMFETFKVAGLFVGDHSLLSLYSHGATTGLVCDMGPTGTSAVPVFEGYPLPHAVRTSPVGGQDLTLRMQQCLADIGVDVSLDEAEAFKTSFGEVCPTGPESPEDTTSYTLPDGRVIKAGKGVVACAEALFHPSLAGHSGMAIHEAVLAANQAAGVSLGNKVYFCGGTSRFPGLLERMARHLHPLKVPLPLPHPPDTYGPEEAAWVGLSIIGSLTICFGPPACVQRREYEESGPQCMGRLG